MPDKPKHTKTVEERAETEVDLAKLAKETRAGTRMTEEQAAANLLSILPEEVGDLLGGESDTVEEEEPETVPEGDEVEPESEEPGEDVLPLDDEDEVETPPEEEPEAATEPEEGGEAIEPEPEQTFKVKVRGEQVDVTFDELKRGYSRTADYTRDKQELAAEKREFHTDREAIRAERAELAQKLEIIEGILEGSNENEPDWDELRKKDPSAYAAQHADWSRRKDKLNAIRAERDKLQQKSVEDATKNFKEFVRHESEKLVEMIPAWKDPKVAAAEQAAIRRHALELGFTEQEMIGFDARAVVALRNSLKLQLIARKKGGGKVTGKPQSRSKVKPLPAGAKGSKRPGKPKKGASEGYARSLGRLAKTGRPRDSVGAFEAILKD